jgi:hypothetical protein
MLRKLTTHREFAVAAKEPTPFFGWTVNWRFGFSTPVLHRYRQLQASVQSGNQGDDLTVRVVAKTDQLLSAS